MTRVDDALHALGIGSMAELDSFTMDAAIRWAFIRWLYTVITDEPSKISRDDFHGHHVFKWDNLKNGCSLEILVQPEALKLLPHKHNNDGSCDVTVDSYQLFTIAYSAVHNPSGLDLPTVDSDGNTSGPMLFYTPDVFVKAVIPGLSVRG